MQEEVRKNVDLVADLDTAVAEINRLKGEMEVQEKLVANLVATLEKQSVESEFALEKQKVELSRSFRPRLRLLILKGRRR